VDASPAAARFLARSVDGLDYIVTSAAAFWDVTQRVFSCYSQAGADLIVVVRLGAYTEIDYEELIQAHLEGKSHITRVIRPGQGPLDIFVISASRRNDAAFLFRHHLKESRTALSSFRFDGYSNPLLRAADLRRLAVAAFAGTVEGRELRPGVWMAKGARLQNGARVLAPAFIGQDAQVCSSAVMTRCSVLERRGVVHGGTVLEDTTVLPHTCVGPGLDVAHAVVGFDCIFDLRRDVEVTIADPRLIGSVRSLWSPVRAAALLAPHLALTRLRSRLHRADPHAVEAAVAVDTSVAALAGTRPLPGQSLQD